MGSNLFDLDNLKAGEKNLLENKKQGGGSSVRLDDLSLNDDLDKIWSTAINNTQGSQGMVGQHQQYNMNM